MTTEVVLIAMLRLSPFFTDKGESLEARKAFLLPTAQAIASVATSAEEAAALIALGHAESKFARAVLEGRCTDMPRGMQCDHGKARGAWQVWSWCKAIDQAGEARCVLSQMRLGKSRCADWNGAFAAGIGKGGCQWSGAPKRVQVMRSILRDWGQS